MAPCTAKALMNQKLATTITTPPYLMAGGPTAHQTKAADGHLWPNIAAQSSRFSPVGERQSTSVQVGRTICMHRQRRGPPVPCAPRHPLCPMAKGPREALLSLARLAASKPSMVAGLVTRYAAPLKRACSILVAGTSCFRLWNVH